MQLLVEYRQLVRVVIADGDKINLGEAVGSMLSYSKPLETGIEEMGLSLGRALFRSHRSLVRLLRTILVSG